MMDDKVHLLLDLSTAGISKDSCDFSEFMQALSSRAAGLGSMVEQATVILREPAKSSGLPDRWSFYSSENSIVEASTAIQVAGDRNAHLLVILGAYLLGSDALGALLEAFRLDSHFGVAVPRVCDPSSRELMKLQEDLGDPGLSGLSRRILTQMPQYYVLPEFLAPCFVVRNELVANLSLLDPTYETLGGALQQYLCRVRRAGFRTAVINHSAITPDLKLTARPQIVSRIDDRKLLLAYPDAGKAKAEIAEHSLHLHESLLARLFSPDIRLRKAMLLDLRGIPSYTNGTGEALLAVCDALHAMKSDWQISILAVAAAAEYHNLRHRYESWTVLTREGGQLYTVALRLSQPWTFGTLLELHRMALINLYAMLDTIAWDILFETPAALTPTWNFMCEYADGLMYNSFDTRGHFRRRFPIANAIPDFVFHHSFDPKDYADPALTDLAVDTDGEYIFVIGNAYDHKHLSPTVDLLSSAFPYRRLKVLGLDSHPSENVETLESGRIPRNEIDGLFAGACLVIFPSLYEGFGFPTLKGLSYGRHVIARRSALLTEIAGRYRGPGKLYAYSHPVELIEIVGKLIHGRAPESMPLGEGLGEAEQPKDWQTIADGILSFIEERTAYPDTLQWNRRERAVRQLEAFSE